MASNKGWFNLESAGAGVPETQFFEGDSAFKFLGLTRMQRLYGFIGCLAIGFVLSLLGTIMLVVGSLTTFARKLLWAFLQPVVNECTPTLTFSSSVRAGYGSVALGDGIPDRLLQTAEAGTNGSSLFVNFT
ncbi:hypothetical protein PM082_020601 [Marasmius tenuissimus]|nr:hypothetical protein PM082_020601 [Marasmius tenuissimus]